MPGPWRAGVEALVCMPSCRKLCPPLDRPHPPSKRGGIACFPTAERLDRRLLLAGHLPYTIAHLSDSVPLADPTYLVADHVAAHGVVLEQSGGAYTVAGGAVVGDAPPPQTIGNGNGGGAFRILLEEGPNLRANSAASAAFARAASFIDSLFSDPITVVVDAEIAPLPAGIIGETSSVEYHFTANEYDAVRDLLINDSVGNEDIVTALPTSDQFSAILPTSAAHPFAIAGLAATRANLLALGMPASQLVAGPASAYNPALKRDMSMTFSSRFPFDYNPADGISAGKIDFTGIVMHEIAHGLGFVSAVDDVDYALSHWGASREVYPTTMDLFRLRPGDGAMDFSNNPRVMAPGNLVPNQVFYDGGVFDSSGIPIPGLTIGDIPLSTGQFRGDGRQASHWKDDALIHTTIGAMDPSADFGQSIDWTDADTRALGLIGWNVVSRGTISGTLYQDLNGNGRRDPGEPGLPGVRVYIDANRDGVFEPSERSVLTDDLGNYFFDNLTAGDYIVRQAPLDGAAAKAPSSGFIHVTLAAGQTASNNSVGLIRAAIPAPWVGRDIGATGLSGADSFSNGTFEVSGAGADISNIGDAFHFVYQPLTGDGTIIARIDSFDASDPLAKAGIMIRESLYANSPNVFLTTTHAQGDFFSSRAPGARTIRSHFSAGPAWFRLTRRGNTYWAFASADGIRWTPLGSRAFLMARQAFIGLAVDSHNTVALATARFSSVRVTP